MLDIITRSDEDDALGKDFRWFRLISDDEALRKRIEAFKAFAIGFFVAADAVELEL